MGSSLGVVSPVAIQGAYHSRLLGTGSRHAAQCPTRDGAIGMVAELPMTAVKWLEHERKARLANTKVAGDRRSRTPMHPHPYFAAPSSFASIWDGRLRIIK